MDHKWTIDKLGENNWPTWKFQIQHYLRAKGLWQHVNSATSPGANAETIAARENALSHLVLSTSASQLYLITDKEDPNEVWETLKAHYKPKTIANKLFLKRSYFRCEMSEGTNIESHLKNMKELTDKLAAINAPISEEDQIVTLLGSLPPSYQTIVTALEARIDDLTLSFVQQAPINEGQKQEESKIMRISQGRKRMWCNNCKKDNHTDQTCWSRRETRGHKMWCTHCRKDNHTDQTCWSKKRFNGARTIQDTDFSMKISTASNSANKDMKTEVLVDCGATVHIVNNKDIHQF